MFRVSHSTLYTLSGLIWLAIGFMLLNMGLTYVMHGFDARPFSYDTYSSFFAWLAAFSNGPQNAAFIMIGVALAIGFVKGRFVLQKTSVRSFERISKLANPAPILSLYSRANLILIGGMMLLGMSMGYFKLPLDVRGAIDVAVGCALMQGAIAYFQFAGFEKKRMQTK